LESSGGVGEGYLKVWSNTEPGSEEITSIESMARYQNNLITIRKLTVKLLKLASKDKVGFKKAFLIVRITFFGAYRPSV
jgi:hypothetical protein